MHASFRKFAVVSFFRFMSDPHSVEGFHGKQWDKSGQVYCAIVGMGGGGGIPATSCKTGFWNWLF